MARGHLSAGFLAGESGDEIYDPFADLRVMDPGEGHIEMQPLGGGQEIGDIGRMRVFGDPMVARRIAARNLKRWRPFEEKRRRDVERTRDLLQIDSRRCGWRLFRISELAENVRPKASPNFSWLMPRMTRRMRTRLPTCRSIGLGTFFTLSIVEL